MLEPRFKLGLWALEPNSPLYNTLHIDIIDLMFYFPCLLSFSMLWISFFKGTTRTNLWSRMTVFSRTMLAKGQGEVRVGWGDQFSKLGPVPSTVCAWVFRGFKVLYIHYIVFFSFNKKVVGTYDMPGTFSYNLREITSAYLLLLKIIRELSLSLLIAILEPVIHGLELYILWPVF